MWEVQIVNLMRIIEFDIFQCPVTGLKKMSKSLKMVRFSDVWPCPDRTGGPRGPKFGIRLGDILSNRHVKFQVHARTRSNSSIGRSRTLHADGPPKACWMLLPIDF